MPRPKSEKQFHVYDNSKSPYWYMWYWESPDKDHPKSWRKRVSSGYQKKMYTREQAEADVNYETENIDSSDCRHFLSVGMFRTNILERIELEGKRESTIKLYKNALDHLLAEYGDDFDVTSINKSAVWKIQKHLLKKNDRPATINKILRHLQAAFERLVDDQVIQHNPFRKFKKLDEPNDRRRNLSSDELKRFLSVVNASDNQAEKRLINIYALTGLSSLITLTISGQR